MFFLSQGSQDLKQVMRMPSFLEMSLCVKADCYNLERKKRPPKDHYIPSNTLHETSNKCGLFPQCFMDVINKSIRTRKGT